MTTDLIDLNTVSLLDLRSIDSPAFEAAIRQALVDAGCESATAIQMQNE